MYPKIEDGDTIVIHKQDSVDSGQIAVVLIDGEDAVVKKSSMTNRGLTLFPSIPNTKHGTLKKKKLTD